MFGVNRSATISEIPVWETYLLYFGVYSFLILFLVRY